MYLFQEFTYTENARSFITYKIVYLLQSKKEL